MWKHLLAAQLGSFGSYLDQRRSHWSLWLAIFIGTRKLRFHCTDFVESEGAPVLRYVVIIARSQVASTREKAVGCRDNTFQYHMRHEIFDSQPSCADIDNSSRVCYPSYETTRHSPQGFQCSRPTRTYCAPCSNCST